MVSDAPIFTIGLLIVMVAVSEQDPIPSDTVTQTLLVPVVEYLIDSVVSPVDQLITGELLLPEYSAVISEFVRVRFQIPTSSNFPLKNSFE